MSHRHPPIPPSVFRRFGPPKPRKVPGRVLDQYEPQTVDVNRREIEEMENDARSEHGGFIYVLKRVTQSNGVGEATFEIYPVIGDEE